METVPLRVILKNIWPETAETPTILGMSQNPDNVAEVEETLYGTNRFYKNCCHKCKLMSYNSDLSLRLLS